jgi:hypothetical protein
MITNGKYHNNGDIFRLFYCPGAAIRTPNG